jgi:hypothetical protein
MLMDLIVVRVRNSRMFILRIFLAVLIIVFLVFPWPKQDYTISGFDPHLIKFDPTGFRDLNGSMIMNNNSLILKAYPGSQPTVYVGGQYLPVRYEFNFEVLKSGLGGLPIVIRIFNPEAWTNLIVDASGSMFINSELGSATYSRAMNISLDLSKEHSVQLSLFGHMEFTLFISGDGLDVTRHFSIAEMFGLSNTSTISTETFVAIIADASVQGVEQDLLLTNFRIVTPSDSGANYNLPWIGRVSAIILLFLIVAVTAIQFGIGNRRNASIPKIRIGFRKFLLIIGVFAILVLISVFLSTFGGHPFDIFSYSAWSYIASKYGPQGIYEVSNVVPNVVSYGQYPYAVGFLSYPPVAFYFFFFIGIIGRGISISSIGLSTFTYGMFLRAFNMICIIIAAILAFFAARKIGLESNWRLAVFVLSLLNIPLLLDSFMWGETEAVLIVVLMFSAVTYQYQKYSLAILGSILAILIKQPAIVPALFMLLLILKTIGSKRFLKASVSALMLLFIFLAPLFASGLHPASVFDLTIYQVVRVQVTSDPFESAISIDGAHNLYLIFSSIYSSSAPYSQSDLSLVPVLNISLNAISLIVFSVYSMVLLLLILLSKENLVNKKDIAYKALACASLGFPYLLTRAVSRRFVVPGFFFPLIQFRKRRITLFLTLLLWTSTSISLINSLGVEGMLRPEVVPQLAPQNNVVIKFLMDLNANAVVSFVFSLINLGLLITISLNLLSQISKFPDKWFRYFRFKHSIESDKKNCALVSD